MQSKCSQNSVKVKPKCSQKAARMYTNCIQNAFKIQSKWSISFYFLPPLKQLTYLQLSSIAISHVNFQVEYQFCDNFPVAGCSLNLNWPAKCTKSSEPWTLSYKANEMWRKSISDGWSKQRQFEQENRSWF